MPDDAAEAWRKQTHEDMGALGARVGSMERSQGALAQSLEEIRRDTAAQFAAVSRTISDVADKLSSKIDSVNTATLSSRNTNWTAFWGSAAGVATVVVGLGATVITPIVSSVSELRTDMKEWNGSLRDRIHADEDRNAHEDQRFAEFKGKMEERTEAMQRELSRALSRMSPTASYPP